VTGYNRGLRLLHADFAKIYEAYLPGWLVLVDRQGRRFCDETAPYGIMDGLIQERGDVAYAIFDRAALDEATAVGRPVQAAGSRIDQETEPALERRRRGVDGCCGQGA